MKEQQKSDLAECNRFLIIIFGLPASGKSTFAASLRQKYFHEALRISADQVQSKAVQSQLGWSSNSEQLTKFYESLEQSGCSRAVFSPQTWKQSRKFIEFSVQKLTSSTSIILEDDLLLRSERRTFRRIASKHNLKYLEIFMDSPLQQCLTNLEHRKQHEQSEVQIDPNVILKAAEKLELSHGEQNSSMIKLSSKDRETITYKDIMDKLHTVHIVPNGPDVRNRKQQQISHGRQQEIQIKTKNFVGHIMRLSEQELIHKFTQQRFHKLEMGRKDRLSALLQEWKKVYVKCAERAPQSQLIEQHLQEWVRKL